MAKKNKTVDKVRQLFNAANGSHRVSWERASQRGYNFYLDMGHIDKAVGSIIITFRFKQGQMTKFPDTTSDYKLYADDWSKLLGVFEK